MTKSAKQRAILLGAIFALLICATPSFGQDLGDAARQERARRQHAPHRATHVYTNDDLKRAQILLPEDRARALEAQRNAKYPGVQATANPNSLPAVPSAVFPLKPDPLNLPLPVVKLPAMMALGEERRDLADRNIRLPLRPTIGPKPHPPVPPTRDARKSKNPEPKKNDLSFGDLQKKHSNPISPEPKLNANSPNGVRVAQGDSLWKIAQRIFGNGMRWKELAAANPQISDPNVIRTGEWIRLATADSSLGKQVVVRPGDTLSSVAEAELGNARAFVCIAQANPQLRNADLIYPGDTLVVPDNCAIER
jgi:nucleoid-associated protein YgaU